MWVVGLLLVGCGSDRPPGGPGWRDLDAAGLDACAIADDATVACWGGFLEAPEGAFAEVAVGRTFACGLRDDGTVDCWGPEQWRVEPPSDELVTISAGFDFACGLDATGSARCWGHEPTAPPDPGDGVPSFAARTALQPPDDAFAALDAGDGAVCGIREDGSVLCWGEYALDVADPAGPFDDVTVGWGFACGRQTDASTACWFDDTADAEPLVRGPALDLDCDHDSCCVVEADGALTCTNRRDGAWLAEPGPYATVAAASGLACALDPDGQIACWDPPPEPRK